MKIFTASFFDPETHGPGRKIGISPSKPKNLLDEQGYDCDFSYEGLSPEQIYWDYYKAKKAAGDDEELLLKAAEDFNENYKKRLQLFKEEVDKAAKESNQSVFDIIGLEEGDTLLSWERSGNVTFRTQTANFLRDLGYDVEEV